MVELWQYLPRSMQPGSKFTEYLRICRTSRKLVLFIVFVALFLDNMLLTTVVPIIPNYLLSLNHPNLTSGNLSHLLGPPHPTNVTRQTFYATTCIEDPKTGHMTSRVMQTYYGTKSGGVTEVRYPCTNWTKSGQHGKSSSRAMGEERISSFNITRVENITSRLSEKDIEAKLHKHIVEENAAVGWMFASKAIVQLITNPIVGPITNRVGYSIPMFTGFVIMFISTVIFAMGESYSVLFIARSVQGIGSACSSVSGMGMLAHLYPDDRERGNAMGIALGGLALGVLVGPPFGGVMYEFVGREAPFLILAGLAVLDGFLQLLVLQPGVQPGTEKGSSLKELLSDPFILIAAGSIAFANMGIAMLEPSLPLWMRDTMKSSNWQQGAAFLPASISYLIGTNIFGPLAHRIGRWLSAMFGMIIIGICLFVIPLATNIYHLIIPNFGLGFAIGMVDSSMMPIMGYLVDLRHVSVYGTVYAIADVAFCLGYAIGPAMGGTVIKSVGFRWMLWMMAIVNLIYSPLHYFLRNPPTKSEKQSLVMDEKGPVKCTTYSSKNYDRFENSADDEEAAVPTK